MGFIESIYDSGKGWKATVVTVSARNRGFINAKTIGPYDTPADAIVGAVETWLSPETAARSGLRTLGIDPKSYIGRMERDVFRQRQVGDHLTDLLRKWYCPGDTRGRARLLGKIRHLLTRVGVAGCKVKA